MAKDMNAVAELFVDAREDTRCLVYKDGISELQAIARGDKSMSKFEYSANAMSDSTSEYSEVHSWVIDKGLIEVCVPLRHGDDSEPTICVLVLRDSCELWRVSSYLELRNVLTTYEWSDGAEALESQLLGYSKENIAEWIAERRYQRAGWVGDTVYMLMTERQRADVRSVGGRALPPAMKLDALTVFASIRCRLRKDAYERVGSGTVLTRMAIGRSLYRTLFEDSHSRMGVVYAQVSCQPAEISRDLKSPVEFLGPEGWSR